RRRLDRHRRQGLSRSHADSRRTGESRARAERQGRCIPARERRVLRRAADPVQGEAEADRLMLFPTTLVGSYPQPDWLIDRDKLGKRFPPRLRAQELWRVPEPWLAQAPDDATL